MSTATIAQAQNKGLRHQFANAIGMIRDFAVELYAAHGGWIVHDGDQPESRAIARATQKSAK